jgi:16S rRNA (guanine1207-N2)-methyltransferase
MRELLAGCLAAQPLGRVLDVGGGDALAAEAVLQRNPSCHVLVTCADLRAYRAASRAAGCHGDRVAVALSDGLDEVEESDWDAIALTISPHLPPVVADRLICEAAALAAEEGALWLGTSSKAGRRARATAAEAFSPGEKVASSGGQRIDRYPMSGKAERLPALREQAEHLAREERGEVWLELPKGRLRFATRVGVFGYRAVDPGTKLLLEWALNQPAGKRIVDVGCGYGVIGLAAAATWPNSQVHLVDVDVRSVRLAEANVELNGLTNCAVSLADAAVDLPRGQYDLGLSNLPAHEGRTATLGLLGGIRQALRPSGTLAAVVPRDSGLRQFAEQVFARVPVVTRAVLHEVVVTASNR